MQKITTFLTFNDQAEEAVNLYTSVFPNSKIMSTTRYGASGPGPKGSVMSVTFQLAGRKALPRGKTRPVRLADGQVWGVMADRPICSRQVFGR